MAVRKIKSSREARRCLASVKESGLTRRQWAQRNGVDGRSLYAWDQRIKAAVGNDETINRRGRRPSVEIVELIPDRKRNSDRYVIRMGQIEIEVDSHFDEKTLVRLLRAVSEC